MCKAENATQKQIILCDIDISNICVKYRSPAIQDLIDPYQMWLKATFEES